MRKKWIGAVLALLVSLAAVYYFTVMRGDALTTRQPPVPPAARPMPVLAARVERRAMPEQIATIGAVEPVASVHVRARLNSEIAKVLVKEGQVVQEGQVLFELDPRETEATLKQVEAALARDHVQWANARRELGRMNERLNSAQQMDQARAAAEALAAVVRADEALVQSARVQASYTTLRAPLSGRIGAIPFKAGNTVRIADPSPLVTINRMQPIYVAFAVPQQHLGPIREAMERGPLEVVATVPGGETQPQRGRVAFLDNSVDAGTGTVRVKALFDNPEERLWPGAHADVVLTVRVQPDALVIPAEAVQQSQSGPLVFVIQDDLTVEARPVTLDRTVGGSTVIAQGLKAGEQVVTQGQLRLVNGSKVEIVAPAGGKSK